MFRKITEKKASKNSIEKFIEKYINKSYEGIKISGKIFHPLSYVSNATENYASQSRDNTMEYISNEISNGTFKLEIYNYVENLKRKDCDSALILFTKVE